MKRKDAVMNALAVIVLSEISIFIAFSFVQKDTLLGNLCALALWFIVLTAYFETSDLEVKKK